MCPHMQAAYVSRRQDPGGPLLAMQFKSGHAAMGEFTSRGDLRLTNLNVA